MKFRAIRDRLIALGAIGVILALDAVTKQWALRALKNAPYSTQGAIDGLFRFRFAWNTGAAFSFLSGAPHVVTAVSIVLLALLCVVIFLPPREKLMDRLCLSMVLAGGAGNLINRLAYGAVVDFIELQFMSFPVFNVADISVVSGAILYAVSACFPLKKGGVK